MDIIKNEAVNKKNLYLLNEYFKQNSYALGYVFSEADNSLFKKIIPFESVIVEENFIHVARWFWHIKYISSNNGKYNEIQGIKSKKVERQEKKREKVLKFQQKLLKKQDMSLQPAKKCIIKTKTSTSFTSIQNINISGEKKDTSSPLPNAYDPKYVEACWESWWHKEGFFKPEYFKSNILSVSDDDKFIIVIPPPNVTGSLHLGHALTNSIEDAIVRWNRMKGKMTLWVPGCDHAGIATQVVVEKHLSKQGLTRHSLGREKFLEKVWEWKKQKGENIYEQLKLLGSSCDWDRACFTMDSHMCEAVTEAFVLLHDAGDIYRSKRLVNWSCSLKSTISDIEVEKLEVTGRTLLSVPDYDEKIEFGILHYFAYPVECGGEIIVATTRLETMLGDTAVAVHPNDSRYIHLHGKYVLHPFVNRRMPIICDEFVDQKFGTGAVKITPGHDPTDYEIGLKHNLPILTILTDDGYLCGDVGIFSKLKRFEARKSILQALKDKNLYKGSQDHSMIIPICSRSKDIIEPIIKPQWYVNCQEMAANAIKAVQSGDLKIIPEMHIKTWYTWMNNIKDWCISRQLWWGHQIPAYFVHLKNTELNENQRLDNKFWVSGRTEKEAKDKASQKFNVPLDQIYLERDPDVLDTWFSSALFPFSVFHWPKNTKDLQCFYPTTLLETGHDILFFWVARMVFLGQRLLGKIPFHQVYLHAIVRDAHGRKMSKSLGNVINPLDVIRGITLKELHYQLEESNLDPKEIKNAKEGQRKDFPNGIPECGADALRFALCTYTSQGRDINLDILRVQGYRFFCNKIWNAVKFVLQHLSNNFIPDKEYQTTEIMEQWILSRLTSAVKDANKGFEMFDLPRATTACYHFWLYDFCDVFLEYVKPFFQDSKSYIAQRLQQVLYICVDTALRLISPFMPFLTEELYQRLPHRKFTSICISAYPTGIVHDSCDTELENNFDFVKQLIHEVRSVRNNYNLSTRIKLQICHEDSVLMLIQSFLSAISILTNCDVLITNRPPIGCAIVPMSNKCEVHILLKNIIEPFKEIEKLEHRKLLLQNQIKQLEIMQEDIIINERTPEYIQQSTIQKLKQKRDEMDKLNMAYNTLITIINKPLPE